MQPDIYGRTVTLTTANGEDTYTVTDNNSNVLVVSFPQGTDLGSVYSSINAMAPTILVTGD